MPDYTLYAEEAGVTSRQMITAIKTAYPHYSKATHSMVCHPERYAVRLTDEAEGILRIAYGEHPGLASKARRQKATKPNRTKPRRLAVYLTDSEYEAVAALMRLHGIPTAQEFLRILIDDMLIREGREASVNG